MMKQKQQQQKQKEERLTQWKHVVAEGGGQC